MTRRGKIAAGVLMLGALYLGACTDLGWCGNGWGSCSAGTAATP